MTVNVVLVEEADPPTGETPLQWLLITTLPIGDPTQVLSIIQYYCIRWQIEVYFRTLKSGCRVESRYFERVGRLLNCLAVYSVVTWKILYLCRLSRECPDISCEVVFDPAECKPVYLTVRRCALPKEPPRLNEMVSMIASLGGYVMRKSTQPGTQTLWLGLQRLNDLATPWFAFGPETRGDFFTPTVMWHDERPTAEDNWPNLSRINFLLIVHAKTLNPCGQVCLRPIRSWSKTAIRCRCICPRPH